MYKKDKSQSIKQWLAVEDKSFTEKTVYLQKDIVINGREGILRELESMVGRKLKVYTTINDSEILIFYISPIYSCSDLKSSKYYCYQSGINTPFSKDTLEIFDQILSTFKFLDTSCLSADQIGDRFKGDECCPRLKDVLYPCNGLPPNCVCSLGGSAVYCTNCGNGVCDKFESICNCPEDCK